jgi:hypothetical protein
MQKFRDVLSRWERRESASSRRRSCSRAVTRERQFRRYRDRFEAEGEFFECALERGLSAWARSIHRRPFFAPAAC